MDKLQKRLSKTSNTQIEFSSRVSKREIRQAEKELGMELPEAYADFVNAHGTFHFRDFDDDGRQIGSEYDELLSPASVVRDTREWKKELLSQNKDGGEISEEVLENFVVFFHDGACNIGVFCPSRMFRRKMAVYMCYHDDLPVEWPPASMSFETFVIGLLKNAEDS